jgi:hypothetical protein
MIRCLFFFQKLFVALQDTKDKEMKITEMEASISFLKEELENYKRLTFQKLNAYEKILEM